MKYLITTIPLAIFAFGSTPLSAEQEKLVNLQFDVREWHLVFKRQDDTSTMYQYVLDGETLQNWSEIVTVSLYPSLQITPLYFYNKFTSGFQAECSDETFKSSILHSDTNSLLYEWSTNKHSLNLYEEGLGRFVKQEDAVFVILYETKNCTAAKTLKNHWKKALAHAFLQEPKGGSSRYSEEKMRTPRVQEDLRTK